MTHFYYVDIEVNDEIIEYKDEKEFFEGLTWNRDIAEEYGDEVDSEEELVKAFKSNDNYEESINGASFLKLTDTTLEEWGYSNEYLVKDKNETN